jgi:Zn-dependent protease with chaperone function
MPNRFEELRTQDLRVATVSYRLAIANKARCALVLAPQPGFVLHSISQYQRADREEAAARLDLSQHIGVMAVVVGSPAAKAGLIAGDQLLTINGRPLETPAAGNAATNAAVADTQQTLLEAMRQGPVTVEVTSLRGARVLHFAGEPGCPSNVEMIAGGDVNAWADGSRVMIGEGLLRRCATDDDLALVIAHEMAHNLLHHRRRLAAEGVYVNGLLPPTASASKAAVRATEEEADRFAVVLAQTAAYDLTGSEPFMAGLMSQRAAVGATHPDLPRRLSLLLAAIADAKQKTQPVAPSD